MKILHRDALTQGGFAGLKEHRLIKDPIAFGPEANNDGSWPGLGNFVYLADARFMPHGETRMHNHMEIDVISVMVEGSIAHQGSMGHGQDLHANDVQVQRAGGEGFSHNEVNPDDKLNRMIQLWILPEKKGQAASYKLQATSYKLQATSYKLQATSYKVYQPAKGKLTLIYGGTDSTENSFPANTHIGIALLDAGQTIEIPTTFIAYLTRGTGIANNENIQDGDLLRGRNLQFRAATDSQLITIHNSDH
ncbi:MAG: pirin family protein [Porticoccus sp.]|nr:pirin family protein [Porticoccus sp.]